MIACPWPDCDADLEDADRYCWTCHRYVADAEPDTQERPSRVALPADSRSEDERKRDAKPTVEALGWTVLDTEQGFRPFECRHCGGKIAGGTRVPLGFPDWLVMGRGVVAFLEWKSGRGRQSPAQRQFQELCDVSGVPYRVVRTTEDALTFLSDCLMAHAIPEHTPNAK